MFTCTQEQAQHLCYFLNLLFLFTGTQEQVQHLRIQAVCVCVYVYVCVCTCMYVCVRVCMCVRTDILVVQRYAHICWVYIVFT